MKVWGYWTTLGWRSEDHTSELQSQFHLVCRLLLEKKNRKPAAMEFWFGRSVQNSLGNPGHDHPGAGGLRGGGLSACAREVPMNLGVGLAGVGCRGCPSLNVLVGGWRT